MRIILEVPVDTLLLTLEPVLMVPVLLFVVVFILLFIVLVLPEFIVLIFVVALLLLYEGLVVTLGFV